MIVSYDDVFHTIIGTSVIFMNSLLLIGYILISRKKNFFCDICFHGFFFRIIYHRREFLIIFLWYYAVLFFIVTIVGNMLISRKKKLLIKILWYFDFTIFFSGLSGFPVLVMTLSGISMLIVYALLKFFENDIPDPRFEVNPRLLRVQKYLVLLYTYTDASFNFTKKITQVK